MWQGKTLPKHNKTKKCIVMAAGRPDLTKF